MQTDSAAFFSCPAFGFLRFLLFYSSLRSSSSSTCLNWFFPIQCILLHQAISFYASFHHLQATMTPLHICIQGSFPFYHHLTHVTGFTDCKLTFSCLYPIICTYLLKQETVLPSNQNRTACLTQTPQQHQIMRAFFQLH